MRAASAAEDPDSRAVRRAARIVGLQITIASGALVLVVLGITYVYILDQLRPAELNEKPFPGEHKIYIDSIDAMVAFVIIGVLAVIVAGVLSLVFTRRAVSPLGKALAMQRTFVQDASHELRTPLTVLDARLQILQRSLAENDPIAPTVQQLRADTRTLIEIVGDLLLAADAAGGSGDGEPTEIATPVQAAVSAMNVLAEGRGITIECELPDTAIRTSVPAASLRRCIIALLDNAIAHSPDGARIHVAARSHRGDVALSVTDEGTGIRGIEPARIFDRFAHSDAGTTSGRTGFGIGLALVHDIAIRHGGGVEVRETSERGTTIVLTLPTV